MKLEVYMTLYQTTGEADLVGILLDLFIFPLLVSLLAHPQGRSTSFVEI
jgi:hypothetical protein